MSMKEYYYYVREIFSEEFNEKSEILFYTNICSQDSRYCIQNSEIPQ